MRWHRRLGHDRADGERRGRVAGSEEAVCGGAAEPRTRRDESVGEGEQATALALCVVGDDLMICIFRWFANRMIFSFLFLCYVN